MQPNRSIAFFDAQFQRQVREGELELNPFEQLALHHLQGRVLDYGCGLGNLSLAAARLGCEVVAFDASPTAIDHLRRAAAAEALPIRADVADLRGHAVREEFDAVACIGLLMFFDCAAASAQLRMLQERVRPGGVAAFNLLVDGTTYLEMFDGSGHCLFARGELARRFAGWDVLHDEHQVFPAPAGTVKCFDTVVARKPLA